MKRFRRIILTAAIVLIASRRSLERLLVICLREIVFIGFIIGKCEVPVRTLLFVIFHTRPVGRTNGTRRSPNESIPLLQRE